jgi:hypothetical protein
MSPLCLTKHETRDCYWIVKILRVAQSWLSNPDSSRSPVRNLVTTMTKLSSEDLHLL